MNRTIVYKAKILSSVSKSVHKTTLLEHFIEILKNYTHKTIYFMECKYDYSNYYKENIT